MQRKRLDPKDSLFDEKKLRIFVDSGAALFVAVVFTMFVVHNTFNYWGNAKDQWRRENVNKRGNADVNLGRLLFFEGILMHSITMTFENQARTS